MIPENPTFLKKENKLVALHKLFNDTYLAEFDHFLAIVKTDKDGNIVSISTFGDK